MRRDREGKDDKQKREKAESGRVYHVKKSNKSLKKIGILVKQYLK